MNNQETGYNVFVDDERLPKDITWIHLPRVSWLVVRSYERFVQVIDANGLPDLISFDHDLGVGKSGYDCAKYLENLILAQGRIPEFYVHSMNPIGRQNILCYMNNLSLNL